MTKEELKLAKEILYKNVPGHQFKLPVFRGILKAMEDYHESQKKVVSNEEIVQRGNEYYQEEKSNKPITDTEIKEASEIIRSSGEKQDLVLDERGLQAAILSFQLGAKWYKRMTEGGESWIRTEEVLSYFQSYYSKIQMNNMSIENILDMLEKDMNTLKNNPK